MHTVCRGRVLPPVLRLLNLVVDERHRPSGVGMALLREVAADVQGRFDSLKLSVRDVNVGAQTFYRKVGGAARDGWQPWRIPGDALEILRGRRACDRSDDPDGDPY